MRRLRKKSEQGFSLVELSLVMLIVGVVVAAVASGRATLVKAQEVKSYQRSVVKCITTAIHQNNITDLVFDGDVITCTRKGAEGSDKRTLVITGNLGDEEKDQDLAKLVAKNLGDSMELNYTEDSNTVDILLPDDIVIE